MEENTTALKKPSSKKKVFADRKKNQTTKRTLEQLIEDALLKEDMGLLYVICDSSTVVGDAAAMWSKGILKVLGSRVDKDTVQGFLKRALRNRILDYRAKSRDLSDITRDNSLVTMLLTAYGRSEGEAYLSQTLTKPLNAIYPILSKCEVDPQKLTKLSSAKSTGENNSQIDEQKVDIEAEIKTNRQNLEQVCERVFQSIFESRDRLPQTILSMCCFLTDTIEEVALIDPASIPRKLTSARESSASGSDKVIQSQGSSNVLSVSPIFPHNSRVSRASTSIFKSRQSTNQQSTSVSFSHKLSNILNKKRKDSRDNLSVNPSYGSENASRSSIIANGSMSAPISKLAYIATSSLAKSGAEGEASATHSNSESMDYHRSSLALACSIPLPASPRETSAMSSEIDNALQANPLRNDLIQGPTSRQEVKMDQSQDFFAQMAVKASSDEAVNSSTVKSKEVAQSADSVRDKSILENPLITKLTEKRDRSSSNPTIISISTGNVSEAKGLGTLGLSEKIIGSFLFLRFIVPGITSPDLNGIMIEKITTPARRGLILCGKMMTALCNDTEFGYKETSLMPCNPFLEKYRSQMKEFLHKSAQMVMTPTALMRHISKSDTDLARSPSAGIISCKSDFDLKESSSKSHVKSIPSADAADLHNRSASHPLPEADSNTGGYGTALGSKSKAFSRSMEYMKIGHSANGSNADLNKGGNSGTQDPDVTAFYQSLGTVLDKLEREIASRRSTMNPNSFQSLVKSYGELRIYLNTGGYVEDQEQNFKTKKNWWVKMMGYLGSHSSKT